MAKRIYTSMRPGELAEYLGVSYKSIKDWARDGEIPYHTTPKGQLRFTAEDIQTILGERDPAPTNKQWYYYTRSSQGRTSALAHQEELLRNNYPDPVKVIKDRGSGLNENRKGLARLMKLSREGKVSDIAITTQDRLTRFGYKYLESYFASYGTTIHCLNQNERKTEEEELMADFMALIASFSGRFYQQRNKQNMKRLLQAAENNLNKEQ